jgi:hypothetical protein
VTAEGEWHFERRGSLVVGSRTPPVEAQLAEPLGNLLLELGSSRLEIDWYLDLWRKWTATHDPEHAIVGNWTAVRIDGDQAIVEPLDDGQWDGKPVVVPVALAQEMFDRYRAWALAAAG